ncbi:MAG TPA: LLM class flavin-dependent oxidoreductase [Pseudonocardia sp.]
MKVIYTQHIPYRHLPEDFISRYREPVVTNPYYELVDPDLVHADIRASLDEAMHAARAGFDAVATSEHGGSSYDMNPNPGLGAAAFAYATEAEGLATGIFTAGRSLGKTREPLRVAEEQAWLDCLSGGRLISGFPVGLAYDANLNAGIPPIETRGRFDENFELVLRAWTERAPFPFNGRYSQHMAVNIWPRPVQNPHPPVNVTGVGNPNTTRFALERDLGFNLVALGGHPEINARPIFDHLWRTADELGTDDNPYRAGFAVWVAVADTDAQAEQLYAPHIEYSLRTGIAAIPPYRLALPGGISPPGLRALLGRGGFGQADAPSYADAVKAGLIIAGSAATVGEQLAQYARDFRVGNLLVFLQIGSMPQELTTHNIDQFATGVLPHLRPLWSDYDDANRWWPVRLGGQPASHKQADLSGTRLT